MAIHDSRGDIPASYSACLYLAGLQTDSLLPFSYFLFDYPHYSVSVM